MFESPSLAQQSQRILSHQQPSQSVARRRTPSHPVSPSKARRHNSKNKQKIINLLIKISIVLLVLIWTALFFRRQIVHHVRLMMQTQGSRKYKMHTVGNNGSGTAFNDSQVDDQQVHYFEQQIALLLQPYSDIPCQPINIQGNVLCSSYLANSSTLLNMASKQSDLFGCHLALNYPKITQYYYNCHQQHFPKCSSKIKSTQQCVAEINQQFWGKQYVSLPNALAQTAPEGQMVLLRMQMREQEAWNSWRALPLVQLDRIAQLVLEVELGQGGYYWGTLQLFNNLLTKFYPVDLHMSGYHCHQPSSNHFLPSSLFRVTLINKQLSSPLSAERSFHVVHAPFLNSQHTQLGQDCQLKMDSQINQQKSIELVQIKEKNVYRHVYQSRHRHKEGNTLSKMDQDDQYYQQQIRQDRREYFYQFLATAFQPYSHTNCHHALYGHPGEQFVLCANLLSQVSALLNLGQSGEDSFGCQMSMLLSIPNYLYSCPHTSSVAASCPSNNGSTKVIQACIGQRSQLVPTIPPLLFYSIQDIINARQLNMRHIIIKIDLDGYQWNALKNVPLHLLENVDQIVVKWNVAQLYGLDKDNVQIVQALLQQFVPVSIIMDQKECRLDQTTTHNQGNLGQQQEFKSILPSLVFQTTLVNKQILQLHSPSRSYSPHDLYPSTPCQLSDP